MDRSIDDCDARVFHYYEDCNDVLQGLIGTENVLDSTRKYSSSFIDYPMIMLEKCLDRRVQKDVGVRAQSPGTGATIDRFD
ncbi:hypothetical protein F441_15171 [Phytophthora nicotianae CJ01A1]|nr:hypothetical protein F441_15171 [Phytophthora nicotianae CJ01A1]